MKLTVLNSGSSGNGYVLEARDSALVLECGVPPKDMFKLSGVPVSKIAGCLLSHEHLDHARYAERYAQLGLRIFASPGTIMAMKKAKEKRGKFIPEWQFSPLQAMHMTQIGDWVVAPFDVPHDAEDPLGFMIGHRECGKILFVTDASFCRYNFYYAYLDHILVEANYDDGFLNENVVAGRVDAARAERTRRNHMSIRQACDLIAHNQTANLKTVLLIHLSGDNADAAAFASRAAETAPYAHVAVAGKGTTIELNKIENFAVL